MHKGFPVSDNVDCARPRECLTNYTKPPLGLGQAVIIFYGQLHSRQSDRVITRGPIFAKSTVTPQKTKRCKALALGPIPRHAALINTDATPTKDTVFTLQLGKAVDYHSLSPAHRKSARIQLFSSHVCGHLGFLGVWPTEKRAQGF